MKDSFVIYTKYEEQIALLTDQQAGVLLRSLFCYQSEKTLPKMDDVVKMIFTVIRQQIDFDNQKYDEICKAKKAAGEKGAEFGKLGGRPSKRVKTTKTPQGVMETPQGLSETAKTPESESDNDTDIYPPLFIPPPNGGEKQKTDTDLFFEKYPRYAKDRSKMREDVDYKRLIEEFEKSTYLRSLYTVKQINENYPLIVAGDFRDKEKQADGATAGRELMAARERWYTAKRIQAENRAEGLYNRFLLNEGFRNIEKRLKELMPEMARLEVDISNGDAKAKTKLVKLEQERGRLQQQKTAIIERNGMTEEDLKPQYDCLKCKDTGFKKDGTMCDCYVEEQR